MSALRQVATDYLVVRRALGSKLVGYDHLLDDFITYLDAAGATRVTTEVALAWAQLPGADAHPAYLANRLLVVRGFARHAQAFDPLTEVPPARSLPSAACRAVPYLYSEAEVAALMRAAHSLTPALRGATYATVIGLMRATGMRIGEVVRLDQDDVDFTAGSLVVWSSKFNKSRELALHESTLEALGVYAALRRAKSPESEAVSFFISQRGTRLTSSTVEPTFQHLAKGAGLHPRSARCRPRMHDLRHTFASTQLLEWYRKGLDVEVMLPLLSTYMGHSGPAATYWYLSALPELLALVVERRDHVLGARA